MTDKERVVWGIQMFMDTPPLVEYDDLGECIAVCRLVGGGTIQHKVICEGPWQTWTGQ